VNHRKRSWLLILGTAALMALLGGCKKKQPPTPPPTPPPQPVTATLSANPANIDRGQSSTLTWSTSNADDVNIDGIGKVSANGSQSVSPTSTTTYRLSATGKGGTQEASATVNVSVPTPTPTPTPAPTPPPPGDQDVFDQNIHAVLFDYDKYDLRADAQQSLAHAGQVIAQHPNWVVQIAGNCDERGSTEYNLTLGENRAKAAKDALVQAGANANQIKTISYGKEKPVCTDANEDCWQRNRNATPSLLQH